MSELIVVLQRDAASGATTQPFGERSRVTQRFGRRVFILDGSDDELAAVASRTDVLGGYAGTVPDEILADVDDQERLALAAWNVRHGPHAKAAAARTGDGLAWDQPGFEPEGRPGRD
ncbi:MAG: hypothetical protein ACJ77N_05525 [Chloroflexota bacterium]